MSQVRDERVDRLKVALGTIQQEPLRPVAIGQHRLGHSLLLGDLAKEIAPTAGAVLGSVLVVGGAAVATEQAQNESDLTHGDERLAGLNHSHGSRLFFWAEIRTVNECEIQPHCVAEVA